MKRIAISIICFFLAVLMVSCMSPQEEATIENSVLPYTSEYIPFELAELGDSTEELAASLGVQNLRLVNTSLSGRDGYKVFSRNLSGEETAGRLNESYYFENDSGELVHMFASMSFTAPAKFCESAELHNQVIDRGIVIIKDFYDRFFGAMAERGIILDATSDDISRDNKFWASGSSDKEYVIMTISFLQEESRENELKSSSLRKTGVYGYCLIRITIDSSE